MLKLYFTTLLCLVSSLVLINAEFIIDPLDKDPDYLEWIEDYQGKCLSNVRMFSVV